MTLEGLGPKLSTEANDASGLRKDEGLFHIERDVLEGCKEESSHDLEQ